RPYASCRARLPSVPASQAVEAVMNCFNHRTSTAIGICKSCGKGVCQACAVDLGNGLACRDSCEERVAFIARMVDDHPKAMKTANAQSRSHSVFGLVSGILFLALGYWAYTAGQMFLAIFCGGLGLLMGLHGLVRLFAERYPTSET